MKEGECSQNLHEHGERFLMRERTDQLIEAAAGQVFAREELSNTRTGSSEVEHLQHMGMLELRENLELAQVSFLGSARGERRGYPLESATVARHDVFYQDDAPHTSFAEVFEVAISLLYEGGERLRHAMVSPRLSASVSLSLLSVRQLSRFCRRV